MDTQYTNVDELINRLPEGYEKACFETKAIERRREIKNPIDLIKLCFLYLTGGYSLLEISVIALNLGIGKINDVAFLKKFAKCQEWFSWMISKIIPKPIIEYKVPKGLERYKITAIDASDVKEKGKSGRIFKLHYAIDLLKMCAANFKITTQKVGETLLNFDIGKDWLVLADRAYGTIKSIEYCLKSQANFIIRLKYGAFKLYDQEGKEIDLLAKLRDVTSDIATNIEVYANLGSLGFTKLRVCTTKIPEDRLDKVERKLKQSDSKKQRKTSKEALFMAKFVVVITALPDEISADEIISLYRLRWQVEIYFKRLKSIIDFGNVPLRREDSIMTWLNGKLMISLLIEQMISEVSFPPELTENRSIWREIKLIYRMIRDNILSLGKLLSYFSSIAEILKIEKRKKLRKLQMTYTG